ncbi:metal ABC transporter solute-binding protein, Zn/Mn family [Proteiniphilum sp.]|uniref:metal ABC transporter solute-binding protein, Zn/Mn family n=1 Tax=Proteiniphilum sp. TaxID=1926877 RepID=UPI002B1EC8A5|nr:zinc ABC transporter substrate-binding protein [Proteiniphilum sp.]MEA4918790.1 zinc ABC transporter substrate-binding protein [Proteiniphilum sp.]
MQKYLYIILLSVLALACGSGAKNQALEKKGVLTVTIEPQRYFLDKIVGDAFAINTLVPPGSSPETYEPAPSVIVDMAKSDIYFMVGDLGFENAWSKRLAENNPNVTIINCSEGIDRMEGHDHDHDHGHTSDQADCDDPAHHHGDDHGHDHDHAHHGDDHSPGHLNAHSGVDPHVWSSPRAVTAFARNMLKAVVELDPDNEEKFLDGFEALLEKVEQTDNQIRDLLKDAPSKSFIIYHPALSYFARDYGLNQLSIEFEGKSPSPAQIKELVDIARKEKINTIFIERGFDTKNAEVIAQEIGAEVFEINPLRYEWDEELLRIATILAREKGEYLR